MKIVFLLDDGTYVATDPTLLQLRQLEPGASALGLLVEVEGESRFRPLVSYPVDLTVPKSSALEVTPADLASLKKASRRKK